MADPILSCNPEEAPRDVVERAITEWREIREARLAQDKIADGLKKEETQLKDFIIEAMRSQCYEGVVVGNRITQVRVKPVPTVADRATLESFIYDNKALELLQFRVSSAAIAERVEAGQTIPGIEYIDSFDLSDKKS